MKTAFRVRTIDDYIDLQNLFPEFEFDNPMGVEHVESAFFDDDNTGGVLYLNDDNTWSWSDLGVYYDLYADEYYLWEIDTFMGTNAHNENDIKIDNDLVHHPAHYTSGSKEVIDIAHEALTEEEFTGAMKFNIIKYTLRVGKKDDPVQEMGKVANYADYLGKHLSGNWVEGAH